MSDPWLKKNPFMSLWLSGANTVAASMRGHAVAQARRQAGTAATKATQEVVDLWLSAWAPPATRRKSKSKRRR